jgi:hypothetical protein
MKKTAQQENDAKRVSEKVFAWCGGYGGIGFRVGGLEYGTKRT